jgi:hypothetical protein
LASRPGRLLNIRFVRGVLRALGPIVRNHWERMAGSFAKISSRAKSAEGVTIGLPRSRGEREGVHEVTIERHVRPVP